MKLYYAPGACSLADHISLHEAGLAATFERVDLKTKVTETGADYRTINRKGYVPALVLDSGEIVTENIAILSWIAEQAPQLAPNGPLGRIRLIEMLAYISTELHKGFEPLFSPDTTETEKQHAREAVSRRLDFIAENLRGSYLLGSHFTVADAYLFVILRWTHKFGVRVAAPLVLYFERLMQRSEVRSALAEEELPGELPSPHGLLPAEEVTENSALRRFEWPIHDDVVASAHYFVAGDGEVVLNHTEVPPEFSGQGIGTRLAFGTFDLLRKTGRKAVPRCSFMAHFVATHPEYSDVVVAG